MLNYEGEITQANCQEHHLDDVNIAYITATSYSQNTENSTDNAYCAIVYNTQSSPDS